ncbi:MAG: hypothetical protein R3F62_08500 [Planctomycetota bacterium]
MSWRAEERAAALERLAGLAGRGVPWDTGLELLAEEHGGLGLAAARRAQAEGQAPGTVLARAGLVSDGERAALDRRPGSLEPTLRELARNAADEGLVRQALRETLAWPVVRLGALCLTVFAVWALRAYAVDRAAQTPSNLGLIVGVSFAFAAVWVLPPLAVWAAWRVGVGRALLERVARWLPLLGRVVRLAVAARFWRTVAHGLLLEQPLPVVIRETQLAFAPHSQAAREVEALLPAAQEGDDLASLVARLDNPDLREEHLLRISQARGSVAEDALALADLRREQLLDAARGEGALLLVLGDLGLALAAGALLLVNLMGLVAGGVMAPFQGLF